MPDNETYVRISISEIRRLSRDAARIGAETMMGKLADRQERVLRHVERSGSHKRVMSTREAAQYAGVKSASVRRWIKEGLVAHDRGGRAGYRIEKDDLDRFLAGRASEAAEGGA